MLVALTRSVILTLLVAADTVWGSPLPHRSTYAVKEVHRVPKGWSRVGPAPVGHLVTLTLGLKQSNFDELERHLYEVSDPAHSCYGQHLTADEVNELVKPADNTLDLVHDWLLDNGVQRFHLDYSPAKDWITVTLPVEAIERLLDTKYSVYRHKDGSLLVRTPKWSLPQHLHEHIDTIQPTKSFFRPTALKSTLMPVAGLGETETITLEHAAGTSRDLTVAQACNASAVTIACLRTLYGTADYTPQVPGDTKLRTSSRDIYQL